MPEANAPPEILLTAKRWLPYHVAAYLGGNIILISLNAAFAERWWSLWVLFFWSIVLAYHFFLVRGHKPDDDWVWARAMRQQYKDTEEQYKNTEES